MKIHWLTNKNPELTSTMTNHNKITFVLVCSGFLFYKFGQKESGIMPKHLMFIPPGLSFRLVINKNILKNKMAILSLNILFWFHPVFRPKSDYALSFGTQVKVSKLDRKDFMYLSFLIRLLQFKINTSVDESPLESGIIDYLLMKEFQNFAKTMDNNINSAPPQIAITEKFFCLLTNAFKYQHTVSFYADRLNITPDVLNKSVRRVCGQTTRQLINCFLLQEAKWLLSNYKLNITEISDELGFSSLAHFCKFFKNQTGFSPGNFRVKCKK